MIAVEDCLDALNWVESLGGVMATIQRSQNNFAAINKWVAKTEWVEFLAKAPETRSITSICLTLKTNGDEKSFVKDMVKLLDAENAAKDINAYRDAPGLRIWGGATVETGDIQALLPWIEWAYETVKRNNISKAA
jgi:phosphoserine aminotransferase